MLISALAVAIGAVIAFFLSNQIIEFLVTYYEDATHGQRDALIFLGPVDGFITRLKVATYGGIVLALPIWLYQLWRFITPGLNPKERRYAVPFILSSVLLFLFGAAIAYLTLPYAIEFLIGYSGPVTAAFTPNKYVSLLSVMMLAFGVGFLFPVLLVFLQLLVFS